MNSRVGASEKLKAKNHAFVLYNDVNFKFIHFLLLQSFFSPGISFSFSLSFDISWGVDLRTSSEYPLPLKIVWDFPCHADVSIKNLREYLLKIPASVPLVQIDPPSKRRSEELKELSHGNIVPIRVHWWKRNYLIITSSVCYLGSYTLVMWSCKQ